MHLAYVLVRPLTTPAATRSTGIRNTHRYINTHTETDGISRERTEQKSLPPRTQLKHHNAHSRNETIGWRKRAKHSHITHEHEKKRGQVTSHRERAYILSIVHDLGFSCELWGIIGSCVLQEKHKSDWSLACPLSLVSIQ